MYLLYVLASELLIALAIKSKAVLDSGFHAVDSGFQILVSILCQWILDSWIPIIKGIRIP